MIDTITIL